MWWALSLSRALSLSLSLSLARALSLSQCKIRNSFTLSGWSTPSLSLFQVVVLSLSLTVFTHIAGDSPSLFLPSAPSLPPSPPPSPPPPPCPSQTVLTHINSSDLWAHYRRAGFPHAFRSAGNQTDPALRAVSPAALRALASRYRDDFRNLGFTVPHAAPGQI